MDRNSQSQWIEIARNNPNSSGTKFQVPNFRYQVSWNTRKFMFLEFCETRSRETRGEWVLILFPTHPTYQNPININPDPLLCKVSWNFGFSVFSSFFDYWTPIGPLLDPYWTPISSLFSYFTKKRSCGGHGTVNKRRSLGPKTVFFFWGQ